MSTNVIKIQKSKTIDKTTKTIERWILKIKKIKIKNI